MYLLMYQQPEDIWYRLMGLLLIQIVLATELPDFRVLEL
jgi:hypothetical protein